jgi:hypothetical protein
VQAHLGGDLRQGSTEEVRRPHPGFYGPEGVLGGLPPQLHSRGIPIQAGLHLVEYLLVFPAADASVFAGCAFGSQGAARTGRRPVLVDRHPFLDAREAPDGVLTRWAAIRIALGDVNEVALVVTPVGTAGGGKILRYQRDDSGIVARLDLFTAVVLGS